MPLRRTWAAAAPRGRCRSTPPARVAQRSTRCPSAAPPTAPASRAEGRPSPCCAARCGGSGGGATVDYEPSDGAAGGGADYVATSGTVGFGRGVNRQHFTIKLIKDGGGHRTVTLTLNNPDGGASLGSPSAAVLTIH